MKIQFRSVPMAACVALLLAAPAEGAQESWYAHLALGGAYTSYSGDAGEIIESARDRGLDLESAISVDIGLYWPLLESPTTILGTAITGGLARYAKGGDWVETDTNLIAFSIMHFFGREPGAGFCARFDVGLASIDVSGRELLADDSGHGFGALAGIGYGMPVSVGARVLLSLNYAYRITADDGAGTVSLTVGGLF